MAKTLNLNVLRIDGGTQSRQEINQETVGDYAEQIIAGAEFPPVTAFFDGVEYYLADGFHRYFATKKAGKASINAEIVNGTLRDAVLYSCGVNALHGLRRTNADKRKAVATMLDDLEWQDWSNNEIARHCSVSGTFVASLRVAEVPVVKMTRNGKTITYKKPEIQPPITQEKVNTNVYDQDKEAIDHLTEENEHLKTRLALKAMDGTDEEKGMARAKIADLNEEIKLLKIELSSVKVSRDAFQRENNELKKQIKAMQRAATA
jgi:FtsZ-binding cell division protein ZapB